MTQEPINANTILVVDDERPNVLLLERLLKTAGLYEVITLTDPRLVLETVAEMRPDLIMLDLHMPHLTGFDVLEQLRPLVIQEEVLPIVVLTADITTESRRKALGLGATDFLTKPFDAEEVILRTKNLLQIRLLHLTIRKQNELLEERVKERTRELEEAQIEVVERLAAAAESRDDETGEHVKRVGSYSGIIARQLGLPEDHVQLIRLAAPVHDIGKIGIPDAILLKQGGLTEEERTIMKRHCNAGSRILCGGGSMYLRAAAEIALTHHERWDGRGYPQGLAREAIPLFGRIVAVADVFDALTSNRPYKKAWPVSAAVAEIQSQRCAQFDPNVVDALVKVLTDAGALDKSRLAA